tara:strand:+ start:2691 stop:2840 length:150 start_codon:yes stop_codon:yes gene_type:complete
MRKINPIAKAIAISRRRTASLIVPNKKKYDRKKLKKVASPLLPNNNIER